MSMIMINYRVLIRIKHIKRKKIKKIKLQYNNLLLVTIFLMPILFLFYKYFNLDNDVWFLFNHGRYVLDHGIPYIESFSMHTGLNFIMQQWLTGTLFWLIYAHFAKLGMLIYIVVVNYLLVFILYKLGKLISDNKIMATIMATIIDCLLIYFGYIVTRPQVLTYIVILIFVYVIEKYMKTGKTKILFFLPLLSILEINLHMAMWWMLFIISIPFIIEMLYLKYFKKVNNNVHYQYFILILIVCFLCGLINPYGINGMLYLFNASDKYASIFIREMMRPKVFSELMIASYSILFVNFIVYLFYYRKNNIFKISYLLLLFGTLILALSANKGVAYFIIFGIYPLSFYLKKILLNINETSFGNLKIYNKLIYGFLFLLVSFVGIYFIYANNNIHSTYFLDKAALFLLDKYDATTMQVYTNYHSGGYLEYRGIKCYIDARAEVYYASINKKADIFDEYYLLQNKNSDINAFVEKNNFTHLVLTSEDRLFDSFNNDNYHLVYEERGTIKIFARNDL